MKRVAIRISEYFSDWKDVVLDWVGQRQQKNKLWKALTYTWQSTEELTINSGVTSYEFHKFIEIWERDGSVESMVSTHSPSSWRGGGMMPRPRYYRLVKP